MQQGYLARTLLIAGISRSVEKQAISIRCLQTFVIK